MKMTWGDCKERIKTHPCKPAGSHRIGCSGTRWQKASLGWHNRASVLHRSANPLKFKRAPRAFGQSGASAE